MSSLNLVDYHGIFMIAAWSLTAVAISAAHYLPTVWPNKKILGNRIWFQIHRTCNLLAVTLIAVSMFFILYEKRAWTGPWFGQTAQENTSGSKWHSLIGAAAVVLAIGQGLGALLFRYAPHHSQYDMISWVHRKVGKSACTAAAIALFLAILIFRKHFASMIIAISAFICFFIVLLWLAVGTNMHTWQTMQKTAVGHAVINWAESNGRGQSTRSDMREEMPPTSEKHQIVFFFIKSTIALVTAITLIFLIILH